MSWASYHHLADLGFKTLGLNMATCETCAIENLKFSLDFHGDEYDETDLLTLERAVSLITSLNEVDGVSGDEAYAPVLFNPEPGTQCGNCGMISS